MTTPTDQPICGLLVPVLLKPSEMTECGRSPGHDGECVPYTHMKKRQVSYNQQAVLCPICTKRIRLNNNGCLRVHVIGKKGSSECTGSKWHANVAANLAEARAKALASDTSKIFSDSS